MTLIIGLFWFAWLARLAGYEGLQIGPTRRISILCPVLYLKLVNRVLPILDYERPWVVNPVGPWRWARVELTEKAPADTSLLHRIKYQARALARATWQKRLDYVMFGTPWAASRRQRAIARALPNAELTVHHLGHSRLLELHPELGMTLRQLRTVMDQGGIKAVLDTYHALRAKLGRTFGGISDSATVQATISDWLDWQRTVEVFAEIIEGIHLQMLRDGGLSTNRWLAGQHEEFAEVFESGLRLCPNVRFVVVEIPPPDNLLQPDLLLRWVLGQFRQLPAVRRKAQEAIDRIYVDI